MAKITPIKMLKEILLLNPRAFYSVFFGNQVNFLPQKEFLEQIKQGKSVVRWGDGETAIFRGKDIGYQIHDMHLQKKLTMLLENFPRENVILGVPPFINESLFNGNWTFKRLGIQFSTRVLFSKKIPALNGVNFISTFVWYELSNQLATILSDLHNKRKRQICLVAGNQKLLSVCPKDTIFIKTPAKNSFIDYPKVCEHIINVIKLSKERGVTPTVLCATGPTSKALVLDFYSQCQVLDIGHGLNFAVYGYGQYSWATGNDV